MNQPIVCKFGGSSAADASCFARIREIVRSDARRRYIVVSAPGRRRATDQKITDLLYRWHDCLRQGRDCAEARRAVAGRFAEIAAALGLRLDIAAELQEIAAKLPAASADYAASRGEYLCARLLAEYLGFPFLDAARFIRFDAEGRFDAEKTARIVRGTLARVERAVIPGFYGAAEDGRIHTFSRGGSDVTGAIVARAVQAALYENWTDVPGLLAADPRLIPGAPAAATLSYAQLRLLARAGAAVLHPDSVLPVAGAGIPTRLRNTFAPDEPGTLVQEGLRADIPCVSGRGGCAAVELGRPADMAAAAFLPHLAGLLREAGAPALALFGASDAWRLALPGERAGRLLRLLRDELPASRPRLQAGLAVAVLVDGAQPAAPRTLFRALDAADCPLLALDSLPNCGCHLFLLPEARLDAALRSLYAAVTAKEK